jgi:hypothetical protein
LGDDYGTYVCDLLHDWLDTLKSVSANLGHLVGKLSILATLLLLVGLILRNLLFLDVLEKSDFSDLVAVVVNNVAIVVNLETSAVTKVTSSEAAHNVTVLIADLTLLVDTHARHGVDAALLLFWLPSLGLTDDVTVLVVDVAILVDLVAGKLLDITFNNTTNDVAIFSLNGAVLSDLVVIEASEWTLWGGVDTLGELGTSDDITLVVPDLALAVDLLADHSGWVSLSNTSKNLAAGVDNVASLVHSAASKAAEVGLLFLLFLPRLGMALDVTVLVNDVSVFVDGVANELLLVAFGDLADTVAIVVFDESVLDNTESLVASERSLLLLNTLVLWDKLTAANNLTGVVVELALAVRLATSEVLEVTLDETSDRDAVAVDKVTLLVQRETI